VSGRLCLQYLARAVKNQWARVTGTPPPVRRQVALPQSVRDEPMRFRRPTLLYMPGSPVAARLDEAILRASGAMSSDAPPMSGDPRQIGTSSESDDPFTASTGSREMQAGRDRVYGGPIVRGWTPPWQEILREVIRTTRRRRMTSAHMQYLRESFPGDPQSICRAPH
jgi:hypothetical protein